VDSTTAPPSCASSHGEAVALAPPLLALIGRLRSRDGRPEAAREVARALGADDLIIFSRDPELGVILPALGFPQTLPRGREWPEFLTRCIEQGCGEADLPIFGGTEGRASVVGCAAGGEAIVAVVGGQPRRGELAAFCLLLPVISGSFQGEMAEVRADGHAATARDVAQRAEALSQALDAARRNLEEALRAAREGDRRKDEFLAMLGHELRNPLAPVLNAVQVMRALSSDHPALRRAQDVVERQIHSLTRLVDDLLDVSRITRGKIELRQAPVELADVIRNAIETNRPLMESQRHELSITVPPDAVWLYADATRLEQVLANLLNNAAKYTTPGGKIWLSAVREGDQALVRVRDTGIGIAPELLPKVFDIFVQEERSLDRTQGGLGLGLTLVKNLAQMHGGSVEVHSDGPGKGSEFVLRLPVPARPPQPQIAPSAVEELSVPSLCVLVVDDNRDAAETLGDLLELWGHTVTLAFDGAAALARAGETSPDMMLLDIGLPGIDGYEVARLLRAQGHDRVVLVALTGYGQEEDRRKALDAGFDLHMTKPVDPNALKAALRARPS